MLSAEHANDTTTIPIFNDIVFEPTESFLVNLSFAGGLVHRVKLDPSITKVIILDDGKQLHQTF